MSGAIDIKDFAMRVERLCDFLISKAERNGSDDLRVIEDLKEDAANIQWDKVIVETTINGLSDFMKGANVP